MDSPQKLWSIWNVGLLETMFTVIILVLLSGIYWWNVFFVGREGYQDINVYDLPFVTVCNAMYFPGWNVFHFDSSAVEQQYLQQETGLQKVWSHCVGFQKKSFFLLAAVHCRNECTMRSCSICRFHISPWSGNQNFFMLISVFGWHTWNRCL